MSRHSVNRSAEMEVFVSVVQRGGFSAAARAHRMTPSAVSKLVARLEARLGARLVNRSTRKLQLTPEGCTFYERSARLLADIDEAERNVSAAQVLSGRLRVTVNVPIGVHLLLPQVPAFLAQHPHIVLDISLTDEVVDLLDDRSDVAIRSGPMQSSSLVARKLGATRMMIVGAPCYLDQHEMPQNPADLDDHNRLGFGYVRAVEGWPLMDEGREIIVPVSGNLKVSDGEALRRLVVAGAGLARLAAFLVRQDIAERRLLPVLEPHNPGDLEEVHAVYLGRAGICLPASAPSSIF